MTRIPKPRRLACSWRPTLGLRHVARITAFARRLAARYTRGHAARRGIDLLLANVQSVLVQHVLHRYNVSTLLRSSRAPLVSRPAFPSAALDLRHDDRLPGEVMPLEHGRRAAPAPAARAAHGGLLLRMVQRTQRIEIDAKSAFTASGNAGAACIAVHGGQAGEVSLPLALPAVTAATAPAAPNFDPGSAHGPGERTIAAPGTAEGDDRRGAWQRAAESHRRRAAAPRPVSALAIPEQEIERLAERVIGTIDRRIAAQRERLGRQ
jgi:hypothetical protein